MKKILIGLLILISMALGDTVHFKNGLILENCREIKRDNTKIYVEYVSAGKIISGNIFIATVDHIDSAVFDPGKESKRYNSAGEDVTPMVLIKPDVAPEIQKPANLKLNYKMLPLSIATLIIGVDYLQSANDLKSEISRYRVAGEAIKEIGGDYQFYMGMIEILEARQERIKTKGMILLGVSALNMIFAFEKIEVKPTDTGLNLSYRF